MKHLIHVSASLSVSSGQEQPFSYRHCQCLGLILTLLRMNRTNGEMGFVVIFITS